MQVLGDTLLLNGGVFHAHALAGASGAPAAQCRCACCTTPSRRPWRALVAIGNKIGERLPLKPQSAKLPGGAARSYWLGAAAREGGQQALCLLPRGTQEGTRITLSGRRFCLRLGQAVR